MRQLVSSIIVFYQRFISAMLPPRCRYYPSCSQYTLDAVLRFGGFRGLWLGVKRIARCHPFGASGYDPVPAEFVLFKSASDSQSTTSSQSAGGVEESTESLVTKPVYAGKEESDQDPVSDIEGQRNKFFGIEKYRSEHIYAECERIESGYSKQTNRQTHHSGTPQNARQSQ